MKRDPKVGESADRAALQAEDQQIDDNDVIPLAASAPLHDTYSHHTSASAAAKLILCGEHAVVYARPAIALPLAGIRARADIVDGQPGSGITVHARDLRRRWVVANDPNGPISQLINGALGYLQEPGAQAPDLRISIGSKIPIASGMGSGAAVATAVVRALAAHLGRPLMPAAISALVYASEQRFHGTPSGIDNTVIAYEQAIWFERTTDEGRTTGDERSGSELPSVLRPSSGISQTLIPNPQPPIIEPIEIACPFTLLIADTGVRSATRLPVGEVRKRWLAEPARYEALFDHVGAIVTQVREVLKLGDLPALGRLLSQNHALLQQIGVSSPELDALVIAAHTAGALGAKLSGAGWGGVMLALVEPDACERVALALVQAGAKRVSETAINLFRAEPSAS